MTIRSTAWGVLIQTLDNSNLNDTKKPVFRLWYIKYIISLCVQTTGFHNPENNILNLWF